MSTAAVKRHSADEYLALERASECKHEFFDGEIFDMAGASAAHNLITANVIAAMNLALRSGPCRVFASDMRVKCLTTGLYTYPDVSIVCEQPQFEDHHGDTLLNPLVMIEVLSPTTEAYDRGKKFEHYRRIASLREYVLISQDHAQVEHFARQPDGEQWLLTAVGDLQERIAFPALDLAVSLSEIYAKVEFPTPAEDASDTTPQ